MDLFYVRPEDVHDRELVIREEEAKHLARVLRKRAGDRVFVSNGEDMTYEVRLTEVDRSETRGMIERVIERRNEAAVDVTLALSLLKNQSRFEVAVEKATEHGVRSIIPVVCERTIVEHYRQERAQKIVLAAMKQSQRSYCPKIFPVTSFGTLATNASRYELRLLPHEKVEQSHFIGGVLQHHTGKRSVLIVIGPEGGFTDAELSLSGEHAFVPISLGPRRLRSETAAVAAVNWVVRGR